MGLSAKGAMDGDPRERAAAARSGCGQTDDVWGEPLGLRSAVSGALMTTCFVSPVILAPAHSCVTGCGAMLPDDSLLGSGQGH